MLIDLNAERNARAARREGRGDMIEVPFGEATFTLPAELPAEALEHLLDPEIEIAQLIIVTLRNARSAASNSDAALALVADILAERPDLPLGFYKAVKTALADLFGAQQWENFQAQKPSTDDLWALVKGLLKTYGASLGEAFSSSAQPESGGQNSNATSNASTESTPGASGGDPANPALLASAG